MASSYDFSDLSLEQLNSLIDEVAALRDSRIDARRKELQAELAKLDNLKTASATSKAERSRSASAYTHVHPKSGNEWLGRGGVPKAWLDVVSKDDAPDVRREKLKPYRVNKVS